MNTQTETPLNQTAADLIRMEAFAKADGQPVPGLADLAADPELIADFVLEASEYLATVERHLLAIEKNSGEEESIHAVFRAFHTIKGLAAFLGFMAIQEVAHETENILDRARSGQSALTSASLETVLEASDYLQTCIALLRDNGSQSALPPHHELVTRIRKLGTTLVSEIRTPETQEPEPESAAIPSPVALKKSAANAGNVKVDTRKLEFLVDMVGELVIAQSILRNDPALEHALTPGLSRNIAHLARVTEEVQKTAMSMRMVPVGQLFSKMERVIRDLAKRSRKQITLETSGETAELDRTIIEELADPMIHMIRNSVDHGIETPEERIAAGKSPEGSIKLTAKHEAGCILIGISDNGRGLNKERILAKARSRGLVEPGDTLTDDEIFRLIFQPGFSTAEQVTEISGRGVGMDVVSRNIQKLRGRIEIKSVDGQGCTFLFRLPLTLAIIEGLVVGVAQERFIIPLFTIQEMFLAGEDSCFTIEGARRMVLFRGTLLPVVTLSAAFGIGTGASTGRLMIVIQSRDRVYCLAVDQLVGKQEVVIKSLGSCFDGLPGVAGGAILGDGRVGLILDVDSLGAVPHGE